MDIKRDRSPSRGPAFHESRKKYPNFCEKFSPCGSHSIRKYNSRKRDVRRVAEVKKFLPRSAKGLLKKVFTFVRIYIYLHILDLTGKRETCFGVSAAVDGSVGLAAAPNRFLCHTDDCKEIIPVSGRLLTQTIWSFVHSVPFESAECCLCRTQTSRADLRAPCTLQNEFLFSLSLFPSFPFSHRENRRENIYRRIRVDIVSLFLWQERLKQ